MTDREGNEGTRNYRQRPLQRLSKCKTRSIEYVGRRQKNKFPDLLKATHRADHGTEGDN